MQPLTSLLKKLAARPQLVTIAVENPRVKPALVEKIVDGFLSQGDVTYFDYDLQFSSFLQSAPERLYSEWLSKGLFVIQPNEDPLNLVVSFSCLEKMRKGGVYMLDSINSLQTLLSSNDSLQSARTANYRASVLLSVIQLAARSFEKSFIVFDLTKLRPRIQQDQSISWEKEPVGGRMIRYKSEIIFFASEMKDSVRERSNPGLRRVQLQDLASSSNSETYWVDL